MHLEKMEISMKKITTIALALTMTGCATNYGKNTFWNDGGFTETELQPNIFNVRFKGNEFTSIERASDLSMLRASELCLSRGMQYMSFTNVSSGTRQTTYIPGNTTSTTTANATAYGNSAYGTATTNTTTTPGTAMYSPEAGLTVRCLPSGLDNSWDASFLENSLKTKYEIE